MTNRLTLASGSTFSIGAGSSATLVFGTAGNESLTIAAGARVELDASFNRGGDTVTLAGNAASYTVTKSGSSVILTDAAGSITIPVGVTGLNIAFADAAARSLVSTTTGAFTLGSQAVTETASALTAGTVATAGSTIPLTTGLDTGARFTGTAADDTFTGAASSAAADNTFTAGDSLVGGAGTDTVNLTIAGTTVAAGAGVSTSGIERLAISNVNTAGAATVDGTLLSGLTQVRVTGGLQATTVNNLDSIAALELISASQNVTVASLASVVSGAANATTVTLNASARNGNVDVTYNGIETFNVVTTGVASGSAITATSPRLDVQLSSDTLNTVNVSGTAALVTEATFNTTAQTSTQVNTFNASTLGAGVDAVITNRGASGIVAVTGSAFNDTIDLRFALTNLMTINGGDGTDTLVVTNTIATTAAGATSAAAGVSNFEVLSLAAGTSVAIGSLGTNAITSVNMNGAGTISEAGAALNTVNQVGAGTVTFGRSTAVAATTTALTVNVAGTGGTSAISAASEETITVTSNGAAALTSTVTAASMTALTVSGAQNASITTAATTLALRTVDASALTGTNVIGTNALTFDGAANTAAMTIAGSATGRNNITGGTNSDSITAGSGDDTLVGGLGADTLTGAAGNDNLNGGSGADVLSGGDGNDVVTGEIGSDNLSGGAGDDTISAASGADTISGGDGNDRIFSSQLDSDDSIDAGAGTDILSAQTISATFTRADYSTATGDVALRMAGVETAYIASVSTANSTTTATAETLDLTAATGLATLFLDVNDAGEDAFMIVRNFAGSAITLSEVTNPEQLTIDGIGQSLQLNLLAYDGTTNSTTATVFTGVAGLTISGVSTDTLGTGSQTNALSAITAATATGITLSTTGTATTLGRNDTALTVGAVGVGSAQSVAISVGANNTLTTGVITAGADVATLSITTGSNGYLNLGANGAAPELNLSTSSLVSSSLTVGTGGRVYDNATGTETTVSATSLGVFTGSIGGSAAVDLSITANLSTGSTMAMLSGATWTATTLGGAGVSSLTVSGVGNMDAVTTVLNGSTFALTASGLEDGDGISVRAGTATVNVTGTAFADELSGAAGGDVLTGGAGADRFGLTGRTETITLTYTAGETVSLTANGVTSNTATAAATTGAAATDLANYRTGVINAINGSSATSFVTAAAGAAAGDVVVTYAQYFGGAAGALGGTNNEAIAVTTAGDNAGADTISGGAGADTIVGGTGADQLSGGTEADTFVFRAGDSVLTNTAGSATTNSSVTGFDRITDFAKANGTANSETLDVAGTGALYAPGAVVNNDDVTVNNSGTNTVFASHAVTNGVVVFTGTVGTGASGAITLTLTNLSGALAVLQATDIGTEGSSVGFVGDFDGDGTVDDFAVFTQGDAGGTDNLDSLVILLDTGSITSLITTNAATANALFIA